MSLAALALVGLVCLATGGVLYLLHDRKRLVKKQMQCADDATALTHKVGVLNRQIDDLQSRMSSQVYFQTERDEAFRKQLEERDTELEKLIGELTTTRSEVVQLRDELAEVKSQLEQTKSEANTLNDQLALERIEVDRWREKFDCVYEFAKEALEKLERLVNSSVILKNIGGLAKLLAGLRSGFRQHG
jgi:chromosome segregation ATPase